MVVVVVVAVVVVVVLTDFSRHTLGGGFPAGVVAAGCGCPVVVVAVVLVVDDVAADFFHSSYLTSNFLQLASLFWFVLQNFALQPLPLQVPGHLFSITAVIWVFCVGGREKK